MKCEIDELWVGSEMLTVRILIWGEDGSWRQKRWASIGLADIPEEVLADLRGWCDDQVPEEDHHQTALF